jgi:hypothetical protein
MGLRVDVDLQEKDKVIRMNRPRPDVRNAQGRLLSPGEIGEDPSPLPDAAARKRPDRAADPHEGRVTALRRERNGDDQARPVSVPTSAAISPAGGEDADGEPEGFDPESTDYKAFGWGGNKAGPSLTLILKHGSAHGINYCDLASAYPGGSMFLPSAPGCKGNVIRLRVAGDGGAFLVVLDGRRLWRAWELLMAHQTPWVREWPEEVDFIDAGEPVITSIAITPLPADASGGR